MPSERGGASPEPREVFFTEPTPRSDRPTPRSDRPPVRTEALAGWGGPVPNRELIPGRELIPDREPEPNSSPELDSSRQLGAEPDWQGSLDLPEPGEPAERFPRDLAEPEIREAIWEGLARVVEVLSPGAGAGIRGTGEAARWFPAIPSLDSHDAAHPRVPVISDGAGLALGWRVRPGQPASTPAVPDPRPAGEVPRSEPGSRPAAAEPSTVSARRRGVWPLDLSAHSSTDSAPVSTRSTHASMDSAHSPHGGAGVRAAAVVTPRVEIRAATGRSEVSADGLVEYVRGRGWSAAGDPHPEVIVYGDPDTGVGLVALRPAGGAAYAPVCFLVELGRTPAGVRFWSPPRPGHGSARLPRPRTPDAPVLGSRSARAEVARAATNWPQLLEELVDRFGGNVSTLVQTAIAGSVAAPVVARALSRFGSAAADALHEVGACGTAFLLARAAPLLPTDHDERAVRYAVEEVVRWSLESGSASAARCRCHLAYLVGASDVVGEVLEGAHRDLDRAGASSLLRVVAPALGDPRPEPAQRDGWDDQREAVLEFVLEQLEALASEPGALHASLAGLLRDTM